MICGVYLHVMHGVDGHVAVTEKIKIQCRKINNLLLFFDIMAVSECV